MIWETRVTVYQDVEAETYEKACTIAKELFKKTLDNKPKVCYNTDTKKRKENTKNENGSGRDETSQTRQNG